MLRTGVVCVLAAVLTVTDMGEPATGHSDPGTAPTLGSTCPALYVLAVQGTGQAPRDAGAHTDSGALGEFFTPLEATAGQYVQHAYVPYGYNTDGAPLSYGQAVDAAAAQLGSQARGVLDRCSHTRLAAVGYGDGAAAVSKFASQVGTNTNAAPIPARDVAAVALFANPQRGSGTPVLPGRPGQNTPDPVPGIPATGTKRITLTGQHLTGAGIGQSTSAATTINYGALAGRVADLCTPGDLACDTPAQSPIAQTIQNIAAQSNLHDPISAITTVAQALAGTVWKTAVGVAGQDIQGDSLDQLSYQPAKSLGQRLAEASDPNTPPPGPDQILSALFRLGTIGFNTVVSVAQKVFTPATIAELATVGAADPVAAIGELGVKLAGAVAELVPPNTALGWVDQAFQAITSTVTDNTDLYNVASQTQYSDTISHGESYRSTPETSDGTTAFAEVSDWFATAARDIAANSPAATSAPSAPTTTLVTPTSSSTSSRSSSPPASTDQRPTSSSAGH